MSEIRIFSYFQNCKNIVEKNHDSTTMEKLFNKMYYYKQPKYVKSKVRSILKFINNGFFTEKDFKIFLLDSYFFKEKLSWNDIKISNILLTKKKYTAKTLEKDKNFLIQLNKKIKLEKMKDLYRINVDGENILYHLVKSGYISSYFYAKFFKENYTEEKYKKSKNLSIISRVSLIIEREIANKKTSNKEKN